MAHTSGLLKDRRSDEISLDEIEANCNLSEQRSKL